MLNKNKLQLIIQTLKSKKVIDNGKIIQIGDNHINCFIIEIIVRRKGIIIIR